MMQCSFMYRYQHFGGMCFLHPLGRQAMFLHYKYCSNIDAEAFKNLQRKWLCWKHVVLPIICLSQWHGLIPVTNTSNRMSLNL
jgi:hypothetical protein